ncbi:MAG: hypothetical protein IPF46_15115 [Saprospiraceae bacterium]|nr:hypothetical protein [Candidatus Vicinibacter affinis]
MASTTFGCLPGAAPGHGQKSKIYDRWGALMASPPATQGWDGNHHGMPCIPGVYLFHIVLYDAQGTSTSFSGDLTLVR